MHTHYTTGRPVDHAFVVGTPTELARGQGRLALIRSRAALFLGLSERQIQHRIRRGVLFPCAFWRQIPLFELAALERYRDEGVYAKPERLLDNQLIIGDAEELTSGRGEPALTLDAAAAQLDVSRSRVGQLVDVGLLVPVGRIGAVTVVLLRDVLARLEARSRQVAGGI